ncbi:MAG: potassium/proton antiporter [Lentisphaeria bacterium]|jgi:cell volume regulation protein A|nr:potassium/proton antiporter [Lentisphaeria bacterium]
MIETYLVGPLILVLVVLVAAMLDRWSVPVILVALGTGILFGSDLLGWWDFNDVALANQIANLALVFILFQGGFSTKRESLRPVLLPAGGLATWGVAITALATTLVLWGVLHWPLEKAVLLGAIISSTDSAATFSILRHHPIRTGIATTVEIESAANDPMAIVLTLSVMEFLTAPGSRWYLAIPWIVWKFAAGIAIGALLGRAAAWLFNRLKPQDRGHYYVLTTGLVLLIYGLAELAHSSAMLAVFVAGYVMGNRPFVHRQGVANFVSALASIAETGMFAMMGLLVYPRQWAGLWLEGILLFLVLTFVARPAAVWLGTAGMRLGTRQRVFISWAGLRGAVPIILATYPLAAGLPVGQEVLNLVFFTVILSVAFQGSTLGWVARCLKLCTQPHPRPLHSLELVTMAQSDMDLIVVDMPGPQGSPGPLISELRLPTGAAIALVSRGNEVVAPKGATRLLGWDQVTILARAADEPAVRAAVLGQAESRSS